MLFQNTAALSVGRLGSKLLVFLFVRFYTSVLTDAEYGTADLITNLANLLIPLACAGLSSGFFRFVAEAGNANDRKKVFNSGLALLILTGGAFICVAPLLFLWEYFSSYVILVILYVLVANVHYFCTEYIRGLGYYKLFALQGVLNTMLNILFNLLFLLPLSLGVTGYVLSIILADLLATVFVFRQARLWTEIDLGQADRKLIGDILRFCLPLIPATICWWLISVSDRYMVTYFCGEAVNGLYTAAYKIPNLLTICGNIFIEAWQFSAVVENRKRAEQETLQEAALRRRSVTSFFSRIFRGYAPLLFILGGAMIMCSQLFAKLLFDPSFYAAWTYIPVLLAATVFSALANFFGSVYLVEKKPNMSLLTTAIGALINILFNLLLIPAMGAMGAAIATLLAYAVLLLIRMINARRYIPFLCQPTRQWISAVLLVLLALSISPIIESFLLGAILFFLLVLNNAGPLLRSVEQWLKRRKNTVK
ncbi:MAG: polysaccharide biosynthesis C-terminal domain-containing protein [Clostridia bacterium]|nr:polysaccharide biosynthesis C-terminal domain-containing protein [Clostridia bacterium]